ncbi:hypothetical protein D3C81_1476710 [compost metagenome]
MPSAPVTADCSTPVPSVHATLAPATAALLSRRAVHTSIWPDDTLVTATVSDTNINVVARCSPMIASIRYRPGLRLPSGIITLPAPATMKSLLEPSSLTPLGGAMALACQIG